MLGPRPPYSANNDRLHAANLHLYIEEDAAITVQNVFQTGRRLTAVATLLDLPERVPSQHKVIQFGIVAQNGPAVASAAYVKLKPVSSVLQSKVERGDGVFGRIKAGATMSEK